MESRGAVTVRLPSQLIDDARRLKASGESLNELMVEALRHELRRRQGIQAYARIQRIRGHVEARIGTQPDSVAIVRGLREAGRRA